MISTSKKTPNSEQEKAIYHHGGKLLSAGAGSGKTFVLIEHLIFLLSEVKKTHASSDWNKIILSEISKIVLMTFTKKASGEMSVRMMRRVEELIEQAELNIDSDENEKEIIFWNLVRQNLSSLNITTIHGFCHRMLRMGFWTEFPTDINLVSSVEHKDKIQKLFDKWFQVNQNNLDPIFLASSNSLQTAMVEIFSSPELRVLWSTPKIFSNAENEIDQFFIQLLEVKGYKDLFVESIDLSAAVKDKTKKWYELLVQFNEVLLTHGSVDSKNYHLYHEFFKTISRFPPSNAKEISSHQKNTMMMVREFRDDLKVLSEDLMALTQNFEIYKKWVTTISDLFSYIEKHYFEIDGFSFSDLEYYVFMGLKNPEALSKIQESFKYFIVDEFQDTSFIQFEILKKLIGSNSEKLFCVGDRKQAIYGFRGGELQVFSDCAEFLGTENNFFLKNNFRSLDSIINFNNQLFEHVFPLGAKFEGVDPHSVEMEAQVIPVSNSKSLNPGVVLALKVEVFGDNRELDLNHLEARVLCEQIEKLLLDDEFNSICVLYRKLKPSSLLIELLLASDIAFSAQIKIRFSDDPLINIFLYLIELHLNKNDKNKMDASLVLINTLLRILGVDNFDSQLISVFFSDYKLIGLRLAFHKFIFSLGLTNSFHAQNAELIDAICKITKEDMVKVYHLLKNDDGEDYACEMMSGEVGSNGKKRITIMSAHASKGLEYDAVLLGGVHTNGRYNGMKNHVGKFPHSFKWKKSFDQKKFFKSPFYHLESEILALKDFSESKRLLYVACTRAVKHLAYVDLWSVVKDSPKDLFENESSWINALRIFPPQKVESTINYFEQKRADISLIQKDPLGLLANESNSSLGLISELSVTRLATLADCPFKFYLQNICKIEVENTPLSFIHEDSEEGEVFYSSKKRGTEVHSYLSKLFLNEILLDNVPLKERNNIEWTFQQGARFKENYTIISEKMIKFSFFGQMISGTPDLVFQPDKHNEELIIWDFKTGKRNQESEDSYWFQLMSYAFAYLSLNPLNQIEPSKKIELTLLYLDQKENVTKVLTADEITQSLFGVWKKTESLDQVNPLHCKHCEYSNICRKGLC